MGREHFRVVNTVLQISIHFGCVAEKKKKEEEDKELVNQVIVVFFFSFVPVFSRKVHFYTYWI